LIYDFKYTIGYSDALRDVRDWFDKRDHALKGLRINPDAIRALLGAFVKYEGRFIKEKTELDFNISTIKEKKRVVYTVTPQITERQADRIGRRAEKMLEGNNAKNM
jgi:hypothetical protein